MSLKTHETESEYVYFWLLCLNQTSYPETFCKLNSDW